jgi:hypothetical protein
MNHARLLIIIIEINILLSIIKKNLKAIEYWNRIPYVYHEELVSI